MFHRMGRLEYHAERGVLYFYDGETQECLLRVEGVRNVPPGHQIDIHLAEPGGGHHHLNCGNRSLLLKDLAPDLGMFCAIKLKAKGKAHG